MSDDYLTFDQAAEKLMKATKRVKRRTVPSLLRPLDFIHDPDNAGQRLWLEADVDTLIDDLLKTYPW